MKESASLPFELAHTQTHIRRHKEWHALVQVHKKIGPRVKLWKMLNCTQGASLVAGRFFLATVLLLLLSDCTKKLRDIPHTSISIGESRTANYRNTCIRTNSKSIESGFLSSAQMADRNQVHKIHTHTYTNGEMSVCSAPEHSRKICYLSPSTRANVTERGCERWRMRCD